MQAHINADWLVRAFLYLYFIDLVKKKAVKASPVMLFYFTKAWQAQWKMLVCFLDEE